MDTQLDDATAVFVRARPGLLRIAGRILGDRDEAEDVLQEAWLRWQCTDRTVVVNPHALLRTTTVRLAVNLVQSARMRRESCITASLPEPVDTGATPETAAEQLDGVDRAVRLLMRTLTPRQRAVYVLREGFGYPYGQIAARLHLSVTNTRQQLSRARQRLAKDRRRLPVDALAHRRLVHAILAAAQFGELSGLEKILADPAVTADRPTRSCS